MFTWRVHWFLSEIKADHWFISWYIFTDIINDYFTDSGLESKTWVLLTLRLDKKYLVESVTLTPHVMYSGKILIEARFYVHSTYYEAMSDMPHKLASCRTTSSSTCLFN